MADLLQIKTFLVKTSFHIVTFPFNCAKFFKKLLKVDPELKGYICFGTVSKMDQKFLKKNQQYSFQHYKKIQFKNPDSIYNFWDKLDKI